MVNTEKGAEIVCRIQDKLDLQITKIENVAKANNLSISGMPKIIKRPAGREAFFNTLNSQGWMAAERKYLFSKSRLKSWLKIRLPKKIVKLLTR